MACTMRKTLSLETRSQVARLASANTASRHLLYLKFGLNIIDKSDRDVNAKAPKTFKPHVIAGIDHPRHSSIQALTHGTDIDLERMRSSFPAIFR